MSVRIFLVDDHEVVRRGLAEMIGDENDLEVVGQAASVAGALTRICLVDPDVAVLDVRLPDGDGVELCRTLKSAYPDLACLILTSYADDDALTAAAEAGAAGFLLKQILGTELLCAIRDVAAGRNLLTQQRAATILDWRRRTQRQDPLAMLSDQERTVFTLIGAGLTNRQIAERMFLAEKTVKNYTTHLLGKLKLQRRTQVAVLATELRREHHQRGPFERLP